MKKITLLGAHFESGNMGVGALTMGVLACIQHAWPDSEVSLLEYDDRPKTFVRTVNGISVTVRLVAMRFSKKIFLANNIAVLLALAVVRRLIPSRTAKDRFVEHNVCLKHLRDADMVLSIAGGDSFSDIYGAGRFLYIALPLLLAVAMDKKLVLMPQTIGPFASVFARAAAAFIMKRCITVYARDNESLMVAKRLIGRSGKTCAHFCYDLGFILEPVGPAGVRDDMPARTHGKIIVGLNVSGLLSMGGYDRSNMFALKVDYMQLMRSLIRHLVREKNAQVVLVPHVFGTTAESDVTAASLLFTELCGEFGPDLLIIRNEYDQNGIKFIIGQCDLFIGSRMHACIAALSQCIPAVGIAYSRKFAGVMQSIGVDGLIADPRTGSIPEILEKISAVLDARDTWTRLLQERMPHIRNSVLNILNNETHHPTGAPCVPLYARSQPIGNK